jgi:hypothetical protein
MRSTRCSNESAVSSGATALRRRMVDAAAGQLETISGKAGTTPAALSLQATSSERRRTEF